MNQFSIAERKKMRNKLVLRVYLFTLIVMFPITIAQEFFFYPFMVSNNTNNYSTLTLIHNYLQTHYIYLNAILLSIGVGIGLYIFVRPYMHYIMTGENKENVQKTIIYPLGMLKYFLIIPNICNLVILILDFQYIRSLPLLPMIYFFSFKIIWLFLGCLLTINYFFTISKDMRETLNLYTFEDKKISFFAQYKIPIIIFLEFVFLVLILLQMFYLVSIPNNNVNQIILWGILTTCAVLFLINILLIYQNAINQKVKELMYTNIKDFVDNGNITLQHTYNERNVLGSFVSSYNLFTEDIRRGISQINNVTNAIQSEQSSLKQYTGNLIKTLTEQEINVSEMNIAINTSSGTVQHLLVDIKQKCSNLNNEQQQMVHLVNGTDNIIEIFQSFLQEHKMSQEANSQAFSAVEKSLVKTELMNQQIETIHQKIHTAGLETSAIDEVLGIIKNISEQTNLLSMSAAIEAAHGDTSRKGFTLVAEEIRKLAHMSQESVNKIAIRLSSITEHISEAYNASKESIEISDSNLKIGNQLKESISQIATTSQKLNEITQQVEPITQEQKSLISEFQNIVLEMENFLLYLAEELKKESSSSVMLSLNFRNMIQNFKQGRSSLYHIESGIEQLNIIKKQLSYVLDEFNLKSSNNNNG